MHITMVTVVVSILTCCRRRSRWLWLLVNRHGIFVRPGLHVCGEMSIGFYLGPVVQVTCAVLSLQHTWKIHVTWQVSCGTDHRTGRKDKFQETTNIIKSKALAVYKQWKERTMYINMKTVLKMLLKTNAVARG